MLLSILIPSVPSRITSRMLPLYNMIYNQIIESDNEKEVEVLVFIDNKKRSIGHKRDGLVQLANGLFQIQIDDDDAVAPDFVRVLMDTINTNMKVDLILFNQIAQINDGNPFTVNFGLTFENEQCKQVDGRWVDIKRAPFHNMCWKSILAKSERFADASYSEDWDWSKRLIPKVQTHCKINKCLTYYYYNDKVTEALPIFPEGFKV